MDMGIHFMNFTLPGGASAMRGALGDTAVAAEQAGFTWLTVMDHWFQMERAWPADEPMLEGYTTLAFMAGQTERLRFRTLVTGVTYRHPGLLAKTVTTLDVLAGGRAELGIGAAWYEREHAGLGVPFPPLAERFERLEETLQICIQMWSEDDGPFEGKHYQLAETLCSPQPVSSPRPRILIVGGGERKTMPPVANSGGACNFFVGPGEVAHKSERLRGHCGDPGRDPSEIEVTAALNVAEDADADTILREAEALADVGVETVVVRSIGPEPAAWLERVYGPVVSRLASLTP